MAHQSTGFRLALAEDHSGAMYSGVPHTWAGWDREQGRLPAGGGGKGGEITGRGPSAAVSHGPGAGLWAGKAAHLLVHELRVSFSMWPS